MGSNRFNKPALQPVDYTPRKKETHEEIKLEFEPCCICHKKIVDGYYARFGEGGVCSLTCDIIRDHQGRILGDEYDV